MALGNLSKDVFERRTSPGSEAFFLFICLDAIKFSLVTFFSLLKTIYPRVLTKPLPNVAKSPLPVDVRRSKTLLLKLPICTNKKTLHTHKNAAEAHPIDKLQQHISFGALILFNLLHKCKCCHFVSVILTCYSPLGDVVAATCHSDKSLHRLL